MLRTEMPLGSSGPTLKYVLSRNASAIQLIPDARGRMRWGTIQQLPEGAQIYVCGEGFDDRTTKISWEGGVYYMFTEDIGTPVESQLFAAAG